MVAPGSNGTMVAIGLVEPSTHWAGVLESPPLPPPAQQVVLHSMAHVPIPQGTPVTCPRPSRTPVAPSQTPKLGSEHLTTPPKTWGGANLKVGGPWTTQHPSVDPKPASPRMEPPARGF